MKEQWEVVETVQGDLQAEILGGLLEAQGIPVSLSQEGAGRAIGLSVGPLGEVEILVPSDRLDEARAIMERYYRGEFEAAEEPEQPNPPDDVDL
jgi:hypothetical protein